MKLLLDENVPRELRHEIIDHDCETVSFRGLSSKSNGELLSLAAGAGFDAMMTKDTKLQHQQNLATLPLAVVILRSKTNNIEDIRPLIPEMLSALENLPPRQVTVAG